MARRAGAPTGCHSNCPPRYAPRRSLSRRPRVAVSSNSSAPVLAQALCVRGGDTRRQRYTSKTCGTSAVSVCQRWCALTEVEVALPLDCANRSTRQATNSPLSMKTATMMNEMKSAVGSGQNSQRRCWRMNPLNASCPRASVQSNMRDSAAVPTHTARRQSPWMPPPTERRRRSLARSDRRAGHAPNRPQSRRRTGCRPEQGDSAKADWYGHSAGQLDREPTSRMPRRCRRSGSPDSPSGSHRRGTAADRAPCPRCTCSGQICQLR